MTRIDNFLRGRKHQVSANGQKLLLRGGASGVPHGTVLGPVLVSVFVNDLPSSLSSRIEIFANDIKIYNGVDLEGVEKLKKISNILSYDQMSG